MKLAIHTQNRLDNIFHVMGELKAFTIRQVLLMALMGLPSAYHLLSNIFICRQVTHRCASAPNDSSTLLAGLDIADHNYVNISYQECSIVVSYNGTALRSEACIHGMEYDEPVDYSAVSQFDLVCEHSSLAKLSQTLVIAGQGIGAIFFTILSDRFGRKSILVLSNVGLMISGATIAYSPNFTTFAIFKFLVGAFQQGCIATFATLFLEMLTVRNRRIQAFCSGVNWGISCLSLTLWAYLFRNYSWRTLQMVLSLSSLPFIFQFWYGKESLRWLIANGKSKAVVAYIRYATKVNNTSFDHTMKAYEEACHLCRRDSDEEHDPESYTNKDTSTDKLTLLDMLKVKRLLLNAIVLWSAWFTTALSFFAIYLTSTSLAGDPYLNYFLTALMEIPNNFVLYIFLRRYGRKITLVAIFFVVSSGLTLGGIFRSFEETPFNSAMALICSCFAMSGASAAFCFMFFYTPEIFPTNMRNQALGVSSLMGRVGGMIAPFTSVLSDKAKWAPGVMIGCLAFIVCVASILLPETRGRELPQTIEDVKSWFSHTDSTTDSSEDDNEDNKDCLEED